MKMKILALFVVACLLTSSASADRTDFATWTAGGSLMVDSASIFGTDIVLDLDLGQYIYTGLMAGGYARLEDNDILTSFSGGAMGKYHFFDDGSTPFAPYVGGRLGMMYASTEQDDTFALVIGAKLGMNYFLTENVALDASANATLATGDVFTDTDGLTNTDLTLTIGLEFFF